MPRFIRVWEKKRGQRRTGSKLVGSLGEAFFFGVLFLIGLLLAGALISSRMVGAAPVEMHERLAFWLVVLVLGSFILIGGSGMLYTVFQVGTSPERRSSLARRAADIELIRETMPTTKEFPSVPRDANLTNSPGITLTYRLPISQSSAWRMAAFAVFCVAWNVIAGILATLAVQSFQRDQPDAFLSVFVVPFLVVGGWSIYHVVRHFIVQTGIGPTSVEISAHPLIPGKTYEVFVTQAGNLVLKRLRLWLVCEEEASYSQGTDVRTESQVVHRQELFRREDVQVESGQPFECQCEFELPAEAMHSFQSNHNAIHWRLVVQGKPRQWPKFERSFPVIVHPEANEGSAP